MKGGISQAMAMVVICRDGAKSLPKSPLEPSQYQVACQIQLNQLNAGKHGAGQIHHSTSAESLSQKVLVVLAKQLGLSLAFLQLAQAHILLACRTSLEYSQVPLLYDVLQSSQWERASPHPALNSAASAFPQNQREVITSYGSLETKAKWLETKAG